MTARHLLEVDDLWVSFATPRGTVHAVNGVGLTVREGETLGIVGESGSGKSVLARTVLGLTGRKGASVRGSIKVLGREVTTLSGRELLRFRGKTASMIFQDPMTSLNPVVRIGRQISEAIVQHLGCSRSEANERTEQLLREVGIPSPAKRMRQYPHQLSGGMRQRIVIAMALACEPRLLLADEPTTALDVTVQAQILELLESEQQTRRMGMLLITHDFAVVANRADRILVMYAGQVVEVAPTADLLDQPMMPYTAALLRSIPTLDQPIGSRLATIEGRPPMLYRRPAGCAFAPRCPNAHDRCRQEAPPLRQDTTNPDHHYRCWAPESTRLIVGAA